MPNLKQRWSTRHNRPLPESVQFTLSKFENIWCVDGSTLEANLLELVSSQTLLLLERGCYHFQFRLIEVRVGKTWRSDLTSMPYP